MLPEMIAIAVAAKTLPLRDTVLRQSSRAAASEHSKARNAPMG